jgi:hypothetical protein
MRSMRFRPLNRAAAGVLAGVLFAILTVPLVAQPVRQTATPYYDITKEVTITAQVSTVIERPARGMMLGSHLMLTAGGSSIDASLGKWALTGKGAASFAPGEPVEVTGVMKTIHDKPVFIVRTVKGNGKVYAIRTKQGVPMSPQSRMHGQHPVAQKQISQEKGAL